MEELPISSFSWLTNKSRHRRLQSELLHEPLASSSPTFSALQTKELVSQPMCTHISTALEGTLNGKHACSTKALQKEVPSCMSSPLERDDDAEHASLLGSTKLLETSSHSITLPERADTDAFILQTDEELRKASPCMPTLSERENDEEDIPELECSNLQETVTQISTALSGEDDTEQGIMIKAESQEHTHLQETSTQILTTVSGVDDDTEQAALTKVGLQDESISSEGEDYIEHILQQNNEEMQEPFAHAPSPNRTDSEGYGKQAIQQTKGTVPRDIPSQISTSVKETEGTEYVADDMAHVSLETRNMSVQEISSSISSSSHRKSDGFTLPQKNVELQETHTRTTVIEMSLHHHMQQDDAAKEEAATRSLIMNRFLPAAKEVAAEHESSIAAPLVSKNHSEATAPSLPQQSQKIPVAHRTKHSEGPTPSLSHQSRRAPIARPSKPRAQQAPRGFTSSRPLQSRHQEDVMPYSMKSCGFFSQGLKTALFRAHRTVSASARSTLRKKSWAPHPSNHTTKVADAGCETEGPVAREEAMGGKTKLQSVANTYAPVSPGIGSPNGANVQESPRRHAVKHDLSERGCVSADGCADARRNSSFSQSGKVDLAGNQFEHMGSKQTRHDDPVTARNFAALKEQDCAEIAPEGVAQCSQQGRCECKSSCHCDLVKATPLSDSLPGEANVSSSTSQDILSGSEIYSGKPAALDNAFRSAWQDGDDEEPQFFDALSRLDSLKSNASFYTMGSPRSEFEALRFEGLWINDEGDFTDTSSHFETPRAYVSKSPSVLSPVCVTTEKGTTGKVSSLSQRIGKSLKLETESKEAKSPSEHDSPAFEVEPKQGEWRTESFSRLRHPSLESLNGLYSTKASTISPVFPAKCQNNSPNGLGWPFGISTYQASRGGGSPYLVQQEKSVEKNAVCGNVPSPPLPPSPTGSWLGKAVTKNASKASPLATLQQREKVALARKKLDFVAANPDAERRWENVVKESRVQVGHLRFSEELHHQHHPSNRNAIKPLKL